MAFRPLIKNSVCAVLAIGLLSGCSGVGNPFKDLKLPSFGAAEPSGKQQVTEGPCPSTGLMPDLTSLTQLRGDKVISTTNIISVSTTCQSTDTLVTARVTVDFKGQLGPEGIKDAKVEANYSLPYFIAVVDAQGQIISKDVFAISMIYTKGQAEAAISDLLEQTIPLPEGGTAKGSDYKIMVGFQLSEEDLAFNRAHMAQVPQPAAQPATALPSLN